MTALAPTAVHDLLPLLLPPDPLMTPQGQAIQTPQAWRSQRAYWLDLFRRHVYGFAPDTLPELRLEKASETQVFGGLGTRIEYDIHMTGPAGSYTLPFLLYVPNNTAPAPVMLLINFYGYTCVDPDPALRLSTRWGRDSEKFGIENNRLTDRARGTKADVYSPEATLRAGFAFATVWYCDITPDRPHAFDEGVHSLYGTSGDALPGEEGWGAIGAWAWGLSRILDALEREPRVDAARVGTIGHSRLGKTALWAAVQDERFAFAVSNNSGCGGAKLFRHAGGETIQAINGNFPHWFCGRFKTYNSRESTLPLDQHILLSLMAPRPVYVASAVDDHWADPVGEFLSCALADPVYRLHGVEGLCATTPPPLDQPVGERVGYHVRPGGHALQAGDWQHFVRFAGRHLLKR